MVGSRTLLSLFQPGQIGKVRIRNRIVIVPVGTTFWATQTRLRKGLLTVMLPGQEAVLD